MKKIAILLSCMHQKDAAIVGRSGIETDVVVVNQCDEDSVQQSTFTNSRGEECQLRFVKTTERGLSRSRTKAIAESDAEICVVCDDDEQFLPSYAHIISQAYDAHPEADVIAFRIDGAGKTYPSREKRVGYLGALRIWSLQITFRRQAVVSVGIRFDEEMGSGTGHGGGEENAFLYSCLRHGLKIHYVPQTIAALDEKSASQWFDGFTEKFFLNRGWQTERYMGKASATLYALYYTVSKHSLYRTDCTFLKALKNMLIGIYKKNLYREAQ